MTLTNLSWTNNKRAELIRELHMESLHHSINYMPEGAYRQFNLWLLAQPEYSESWAQLLGLRATASMTDAVLDSLLSDKQLEALSVLAVPMTLLLTYEVASDNVAIGIANQRSTDATLPQRIALLTHFGESMIRRLQGDKSTGRELLKPIIPLAKEISSFEQSLSHQKFVKLLNAYLEAHPNSDTTAIEYSLYEILSANIECAVDVLDILDGYAMQGFIRDWLVRRYAGQNFLINNRHISRDELIRASIDAIMVVPTMAYYIAHLVEAIAPNNRYLPLMEDGRLLAALEKTALLVRILNDLGTDVVEHSDEAHQLWVEHLRREQQANPQASFVDLMLSHIPSHSVSFTRFKKDILFGEFNLVLHFPRLSETVDDALDEFYAQLCYISGLYRESLAELYLLSEAINEQMQSPIIGNLLTGFVEYHQHLYRKAFDSPEGEYGI